MPLNDCGPTAGVKSVSMILSKEAEAESLTSVRGSVKNQGLKAMTPV
jgi:hypothetical protein